MHKAAYVQPVITIACITNLSRRSPFNMSLWPPSPILTAGNGDILSTIFPKLDSVISKGTLVLGRVHVAYIDEHSGYIECKESAKRVHTWRMSSLVPSDICRGGRSARHPSLE